MQYRCNIIKNIFNPWLIESIDVEPYNMEHRLCVRMYTHGHMYTRNTMMSVLRFYINIYLAKIL